MELSPRAQCLLILARRGRKIREEREQQKDKDMQAKTPDTLPSTT